MAITFSISFFNGVHRSSPAASTRCVHNQLLSRLHPAGFISGHGLGLVNLNLLDLVSRLQLDNTILPVEFLFLQIRSSPFSIKSAC